MASLCAFKTNWGPSKSGKPWPKLIALYCTANGENSRGENEKGDGKKGKEGEEGVFWRLKGTRIHQARTNSAGEIYEWWI